MAKDLCKTLADLKEDEALAIVQEKLNAGADPLGILADASRAMEIPSAHTAYTTPKEERSLSKGQNTI